MHIFNYMFLLLFIVISGCAVTTGIQDQEQIKNSPFTHGNVQLNLKKGITTQAEVLNVFGAPNVAAYDAEGSEVWTYQKNATVTKSSESEAYGTLVVLGGKTTHTGFEQSSRTMTLIIKFDSTKKIADFKSMTTSF